MKLSLIGFGGLGELTARMLGVPVGAVDSFQVRAPLTPVTVRDLAALAE